MNTTNVTGDLNYVTMVKLLDMLMISVIERKIMNKSHYNNTARAVRKQEISWNVTEVCVGLIYTAALPCY